MLYLMLAVLCSSSIAIIFKYSETNEMNRNSITAFNYLIAVFISSIIIFNNKISILDFQLHQFLKEFNDVILIGSNKFTTNSSIIWAIIIGIPGGILFFLAFIYYQKGVRKNGVGLTGAFSKLGIIIPTSFSIIIWSEIPSLFQWFGIILSLISIILINVSLKEIQKTKIRKSLILLFFFGGLAEFTNKIFQKYAIVDLKMFFLLCVFTTAFIISSISLKYKKIPIKKEEIIIGSIVGIPNLFSAYFLILALNSMKASIVFPIFSATTIVIINLTGFTLFKEKAKKREKISIILTIIALILINLP